MSRIKASESERSIHRQKKATRRDQARARVENLRDWLQERRIQAAKAARDRRVEREESPRGTLRVPPSVKANPLQRKPRNPGRSAATLRHTVGKRGTPITYGPGAKAHKVHTKPPRPRELTDHALRQMTEAELKTWRQAKMAATAAGTPLTVREETALAWSIMAKRHVPAGAR